MTGPEEALPGARLEDFKPAGAGQRRCRSGSMAVEPQPAGRHLGTEKHPAPSVLGGIRADRPVRQVVSRRDAGGPRSGTSGFSRGTGGPPASRADLADGRRVARAARRAMPEAEAATPGRTALGTGTAPRAALGRTARLVRPGPPRPPARPGLPRPLRVGRRRRAGAVSPATVSGSWITKNRRLRRFWSAVREGAQPTRGRAPGGTRAGGSSRGTGGRGDAGRSSAGRPRAGPKAAGQVPARRTPVARPTPAVVPLTGPLTAGQELERQASHEDGGHDDWSMTIVERVPAPGRPAKTSSRRRAEAAGGRAEPGRAASRPAAQPRCPPAPTGVPVREPMQ